MNEMKFFIKIETKSSFNSKFFVNCVDTDAEKSGEDDGFCHIF
jgi:hypothetical protein